MKLYMGCNREVRVSVGSETYRLPHIMLHSPTGFSWGGGGCGPADLALSILCHYFGEQPTRGELYRGAYRAAPLYQGFKWRFIASLAPGEPWEISEEEIRSWLEAQDFARRTEEAVLNSA